tara:strand:+ start:89 stop:1072 length:984 start_codon:yes stop_codon:yes gene_type:complete
MNLKNPIKKLTEEIIINKYLRKLNFKKFGTFNFENDAAFVNLNKNNKMVITSDSISENIDFFKYDDPKSIACKIITSNLSDLSAMGVNPYAYSLNLFLPKYIDNQWMNKFSNELFKKQKQYNFYLIGGDLSKSNKIHISATFFGLSNLNKIVSQNIARLNQDIWITGNLGDSFVGLQILKNKININNSKTKNYFVNKYYYPKPCIIGSKVSQFVSSMKDISDGFVGDLKKMLNNNYGAMLYVNSLPLSTNLKNLVKNGIIKEKDILNSGDNYELIFFSSSKNRKKIISIGKKFKVKLTLIGKIIKKKVILNDSNHRLNIPKEFDHFS